MQRPETSSSSLLSMAEAVESPGGCSNSEVILAQAKACQEEATASVVGTFPTTTAITAANNSPELGDLVRLGPKNLPEHRGRSAIVTGVSASHCTVAVLGDSLRIVVGECWPNFGDLSIENCLGRLGSKVLISGLTGSRTQWSNGLRGTVVAHPKEGHPCFIQKPGAAADSGPVLTFCVKLDRPPSKRPGQVLMELRFLRDDNSNNNNNNNNNHNKAQEEEVNAGGKS
ncbi:unnamed protein product [Polarella glacialis]|uniref:Uncharacterized protein n=1 Tax=Polarella glacialis TaxID=89957 RepID=A0A813GVA9_POLGL|nr:unnamed protein product [Polarella glacialis]